DGAEFLHVFEVILVRVPAERAVEAGSIGMRDLDEGYAVLDQPPGEQAALAEETAPVGIADRFRLLTQVERLGGRRAHERHGTLVGRAMAKGRGARAGGDELLLHLLQKLRARRGTPGGHAAGQREIFDLDELSDVRF